jgi:putative addiction module component (TIGR02574 family)
MVIETLPELAKLTEDERETLALELLESIRARQQVNEVSPELVAELEARRADFLEHPDKTKTWTEVKAGIFARYRSESSDATRETRPSAE